jgi:hypothetical protein
MGEIYSRAEVVVAWLGAGEPEERALATMRVVATCRSIFSGARGNRVHRRLAKKFREEDGQAFLQVIYTFWSRAWIVQEMALASRVKLLAGQAEWDL